MLKVHKQFNMSLRYENITPFYLDSLFNAFELPDRIWIFNFPSKKSVIERTVIFHFPPGCSIVKSQEHHLYFARIFAKCNL